MHCTLLVPELLPPGLREALQSAPRLPRLAALLARGDSTVLPAGDMETALCEMFGVARQHDWPVAPLTLAADGGDAGDGYWLRCDPVHFQMRQSRMHLSTAAGTPAPAEAQALVDALNAHFEGDGLLFRAGSGGRCYLRTGTHTELTTQPLAESIDREVDSRLPGGADSGHWRRVLNEIQMLLHAHPLNAEREARGLPAFNSVWLWGGGRMPQVSAVQYERLWADEPLACALAAQSATPFAPLPPRAEAVLAAGGDALVVLTAARDAGHDIEAWQNAVEMLERDWFSACYAALKTHRLAGLTIVATCAPRGRRVVITTRNLWRWWRRARPLAAYG